tara:strand:- start:197 stop:643 length:447 start_codon:yes stop_codon:yes gene_type:complete
MQIPFESFLLVGGGVVLLLLAILKFNNGLKTKSWPVTKGTVIGTSTHFTGENLGPDSMSYHKRRIYYSYTVEHKLYKSRQISKYLLNDYFKYNLLPSRYKKYVKGLVVNVYHNPQNHGEAVLENRAPISIYLEFIASAVAICLGIWLY